MYARPSLLSDFSSNDRLRAANQRLVQPQDRTTKRATPGYLAPRAGDMVIRRSDVGFPASRRVAYARDAFGDLQVGSLGSGQRAFDLTVMVAAEQSPKSLARRG